MEGCGAAASLLLGLTTTVGGAFLSVGSVTVVAVFGQSVVTALSGMRRFSSNTTTLHACAVQLPSLKGAPRGVPWEVRFPSWRDGSLAVKLIASAADAKEASRLSTSG